MSYRGPPAFVTSAWVIRAEHFGSTIYTYSAQGRLTSVTDRAESPDHVRLECGRPTGLDDDGAEQDCDFTYGVDDLVM